MRENKIARFLKDIFWFFFFLSLNTNNIPTFGMFSLVKPNFFLPLRENEKNGGARKKMRENKTHTKISWTKVYFYDLSSLEFNFWCSSNQTLERAEATNFITIYLYIFARFLLFNRNSICFQCAFLLSANCWRSTTAN